MHLASFIQCCILLAVASDDCTCKQFPDKREVLAGEKLTLHCPLLTQATERELDSLAWFCVTSTGTTLFVEWSWLAGMNRHRNTRVITSWPYANRVTLTPSGTLVLSKVKISDGTDYRCTVRYRFSVRHYLITVVVKPVAYSATVEMITSSVSKSWIGQTVELKCLADGFPTPNVTWIKPDGSEIKNQVTSKVTTVAAVMNVDQDFGLYTCRAENGVGMASSRTVQVKQIKAPGSPKITSTAADIHATSLTVKWTAPADDGGSPIAGYYVVLLQGENIVQSKNISDPTAKQIFIGGLDRNSNYNVTVYARNEVFEGDGGQGSFKTNPAAPGSPNITSKRTDIQATSMTVRWTAPADDGGSPIIGYCVVVLQGSKIVQRRDINDPAARKIFIGGLDKNSNYNVTVYARNDVCEGDSSLITIRTYLTAPGLPNITLRYADIRATSMTIRWTASADNGGSPITAYRVVILQGGEVIKSDNIRDPMAREALVEGLRGNFTYIVRVFARNSAFEGNASEEVFKTNPEDEVDKEDKNAVIVNETHTHGQSSKCGLVTEGSLFVGRKLSITVYTFISGVAMLSIVVIILVVVLCRTRRGRLEIAKLRREYESAGDERDLTATILRENQVETDTLPSGIAQSNDTRENAFSGAGDYMPLHPSTRSWEINREQVEIIKVIGKGAFSEVARATVWKLNGDQEYTTVAAKMLRANAPESDREDLLSELELIKRLKPHPHVIKLMACITKNDPLMVLIEFVPFGDLLGYLRKSRGLNDTYFDDSDVRPKTCLTAEQLMKFAWQVADGMCYLSSKKIIHRDLAARNVLVGEGEKCKVTDFGMARNVHDSDIYTRKRRLRLPVKWTAFESLLYGLYTTQSDVWSYGILLYEIITIGGTPYPNISVQRIAGKLAEGYRMPKPSHVDAKLYEIMLNCWKEEPNDRPTFKDLEETMKQMEKNCKHSYVNLCQYDHTLYANVNDLAEHNRTARRF